MQALCIGTVLTRAVNESRASLGASPWAAHGRDVDAIESNESLRLAGQDWDGLPVRVRGVVSRSVIRSPASGSR